MTKRAPALLTAFLCGAYATLIFGLVTAHLVISATKWESLYWPLLAATFLGFFLWILYAQIRLAPRYQKQ